MLFLLALLAFAEALMHIRDPSTWPHVKRSKGLYRTRKSSYKWSEEWLENVPVDHFSFGNKDEFKLR
ncbi:unnamed protein product [Cylicostephanus goldi]|uniref:Uncharacterized protein n=1 Tax=Cylicostephanus goldi TaxID=71465 RepID=A0A3P7MQA9_CYLGO|nr:unnamed protein product [Cylicostephanus goldi]